MLILGLTGGIATGKSTVSKIFASQGIPIIDADIIARQVVSIDTSAYDAIIRTFSSSTPDLLLPDKQLNRAALGRRVFGDEVARKQLNAITHPAVQKSMVYAILKHYLQGYHLIVIDVPLLFEGNMDLMCGLCVVVDCDAELQLQRLLQRDSHLSEADAQKRMQSQMPMSKKRELADIVINNDGSLDDLKDKVEDVIRQVKPWWIVGALEWVVPPVGLGSGIISVLRRWYWKRKTQEQTRAKL